MERPASTAKYTTGPCFTLCPKKSLPVAIAYVIPMAMKVLPAFDLPQISVRELDDIMPLIRYFTGWVIARSDDSSRVNPVKGFRALASGFSALASDAGSSTGSNSPHADL